MKIHVWTINKQLRSSLWTHQPLIYTTADGMFIVLFCQNNKIWLLPNHQSMTSYNDYNSKSLLMILGLNKKSWCYIKEFKEYPPAHLCQLKIKELLIAVSITKSTLWHCSEWSRADIPGSMSESWVTSTS